MTSAFDDIAARDDVPATVCWDGSNDASLALSLAPPATDCVERDLFDTHRRIDHPRAVRRHLGLVVTTRSAYRHRIAKTFVDAIAERIRLSDDLRERAHTALHEAVTNAVLHGNLGLNSKSRNDLAGLALMQMAIEQKLSLPDLALSAIRVDAIWNSACLVIMVRDSGSGFDKLELPPTEEWPAPGPIGSGQGLLILNAFCDRITLLRGGTLIKLGFLL